MTKINLIITILLTTCLQTFAQHIGMTFQNAEKQGISIDYLDSIYADAVNEDTLLAVFKTEKEQEAMHKAYIKLLQDFGNFLSINNFKWQKPTRCYNRIYFSADGTIDYSSLIFLVKMKTNLPKKFNMNFNGYLMSLFQITNFR